MPGYADEGIRKADESLKATAVLAERYQQHIMGFVLMGVGQAYERGVKVGKERAEKEAQPLKDALYHIAYRRANPVPTALTALGDDLT